MELQVVAIVCVLLGALFGMFVQSKRMVVATLEQDSDEMPFLKISFHNMRLLKNTEKVEVIWDIGLESTYISKKHRKLQIPYHNGEKLNRMKAPKSILFMDGDGNVLYDTTTV